MNVVATRDRVLGRRGDGSVLLGFDGSHAAMTAVSIAAELMPLRHARVAHLWTAPGADSTMHRRLARRAWNGDHLWRLVRREAASTANSVAARGVTLAEAAGWTAEPFVHEVHGGEGLALAELAERFRPAVVVVGSRGAWGLPGLFSSVSRTTVNYSSTPVLVVPPLLAEERAAAVGGAVMIAHDGSPAADRARVVAADLFRDRLQLVRYVGTPAIFGGPSPRVAIEPEVAGRNSEEGLPPETVKLATEEFGPRSVADTLAEEAAAQGVGVIVVASRRRSTLRERLLGSNARALLRHGHRAVLVVPPDT
ncbi:universal stress protein [Actinomycetospora chibensis]|uniref:Universal stress protein n=1 Tax=Actinomycetospora chibensis TaxID=663606 RepID=A0ABV9RRJ7_9PSEU